MSRKYIEYTFLYRDADNYKFTFKAFAPDTLKSGDTITANSINLDLNDLILEKFGKITNSDHNLIEVYE